MKEWRQRLYRLYGNWPVGIPARTSDDQHDAAKGTKMAFIPKDMSGSLFSAKENKRDAKDRDYSGSIMINNEEYWLSGWKRETREGRQYLSLSAKPKAEKVDRSRPLKDELNDDIGF